MNFLDRETFKKKLMLNPRGVLLRALTDTYVSRRLPHLPLKIYHIWQRIETHLENVHWGEDGEKLCASAPHDFYGRRFDRPDSCANWVSYIVTNRLVFTHDTCSFAGEIRNIRHMGY
jgi:hypothetical protein